MARKRMFDIDIVENDAFLDMPLTSQALYMHLCMNADDDGFVSPKRIMRMTGAAQDDLNILLAKRYLLGFESGIVVIKHWHKNNTIKNDRYIETTFKTEKSLLTRNEWGQYTEITKIQQTVLELQMAEPFRNQNGSNPDPQYSIEKSSIVKNSKDNVSTKVLTMDDAEKTLTVKIDNLFQLWNDIVGYPITSQKKSNRQYASKLIKENDLQDIERMLRGVALSLDDRFAPRISNFSQLYRKWDDLKLWGMRNMRSNANRGIRSI